MHPSLVYDKAQGRLASKTGADIRVEISEDKCDVDDLRANPTCSGATPGPQVGVNDDYFHTFVEHYVAKGYERGKTIRYAPYDWRLAPGNLLYMYRDANVNRFSHTAQLNIYYHKLQSMVQNLCWASPKSEVTLVAHGTGAPVVLYFLNNFVNQRWKNTYIHAFITLSGAWSGSNGVVETIISGQKLTALEPLVDNGCVPSNDLRLLYRDAARTFPGVTYALPKSSVWGDQIIVTFPGLTYKASEYAQLFLKSWGYRSKKDPDVVSHINDNEKLRAPQVPTYCFYGTEVDTPETFEYTSIDNPKSARVTNGDGDGTVNRPSAEVCLNWKYSLSPGQKIESKAFPGIDHISIVKNVDVLHEIDGVVLTK